MNNFLKYISVIYFVLSTSAYAAWPDKTLKIVVPYGPGGGVDTFARPLTVKMGEQLGNPFVVDKMGKAPIHIAAAKLDIDTFEALVRHGADPMMPDDDGNTFLHIMAMGTIKDREYDFIKMMVVRHGLRLTRNKENRTALNIIRANSAQGERLRG
jgi:hypothetical protein